MNKKFKYGDLVRVTKYAVYECSIAYEQNYGWRDLIGKIVMITSFYKRDLVKNFDRHRDYYYVFPTKKRAVPDCFLEKVE